MPRQMAIASALALLAASTLAAQTPAGGVEALAWMEGAWSGEKDGVVMEELWTGPRGGALLGLHRDVKGQRLLSWEFLRIQATDAGTFYYASPRSAPPTAFKLVETGHKRAVFENKEHDFPQRILYWVDARGALHARIEGPQGGKTVAEEWVWIRTK
jgi:Domain of unknown function (DUF6265)